MLRGFAFLLTALLAVVGINGASQPVNGSGSEEAVFPNQNHATKLFNTTDLGGGGGGEPERIGKGSANECTKESIVVVQGATDPLPSGIPTYTVQVENACLTERCSIYDIHLSCGWFSSARTIDPAVFRRIAYDDCLVNDGKPLNPGESVNFQYADTFMYQLSVSSVSCT